jgi:hypothetical protein
LSTEAKSRLVLFFLRPLSMDGLRHDPRISRRDLWNAGRLIGGKKVLTAVRLLEPDKFPLWQTAQGRALEFPCGSPRCFLPTVNAVAKHPCNHLTAPKEMDLKTMRLSLRAPFCVDAPDIRFRIRIGASSHKNRLTRRYLNNSGNQRPIVERETRRNVSGEGRFQERHFLSYSSSGNSA